MNKMVRYYQLIIVLTCCLVNSYGQRTGVKGFNTIIEKHTRNFYNPPTTNRPGAYWCWLNGDVTKASITHDLEEMKEKGMGSAEIWDVAAIYNPGGSYGNGPRFMGDESVGFILHALAEGKRLGMRMGMVTSSGWNAGGSWVTPDWAAKALFVSERSVTGPFLYSDSLPMPQLPKQCPKDQNGNPLFKKEIAVLAIRDNPDKKISNLKDVQVLTAKFNGKKLVWQVPEGKWSILRFVCSNTGQHLIVPSPKSDGLFIDFFDPQATIRHLGYILNRLHISKKNAASSGLSYLSFDSMELDEATAWTNSMDSIFLKHNGYSIIPYLPVFAGWKLPEGNDTFLQQFKQTVSDQLIFSHYTTGRDFLAGYGIELVAEAGGPGPPVWNTCPVDAVKALGNVSVPRGEFWIRNRHNIFLIKEIASASHIYGLNIVDGESFTTWRRWKDAPHDLKQYVDRAFCEGLNNLTFHAFANTRPEFGFPGRAYHAGSDINPTATWWKDARPFIDYLSRCSYLLRQGKPVSDVAYYYGDKAPNFFPAFQKDPDKPRLEGLGAGYDFDIMNTEILLNKLSVKNGRLVLPGGVSYSLLVIPGIKDIPASVQRKLETLLKAGGQVLFENTGMLSFTVHNAALKNMRIDDALRQLSVPPDFTANNGSLDFIHRKTDIGDLYFISNTTDASVTRSCNFRAAGKQVEYWDPVSGKQYTMSADRSDAGSTTLTLQLAPHASCFILLTNEKRQLPAYRNPVYSSTELAGQWMVRFPENWGAPASAPFSKLISWTDHPDAGIRYFSGTAVYQQQINLSEASLRNDSVIMLNLGEVRDVARVLINGKNAGVVWTYPYSIDIRKYLKPGNNTIEVEITNNWVNRLTGDMLAGEGGKKYCQTNVPYIIKDRGLGGDEKFNVQPSGLLGPVMLQRMAFTGK
jgi:hypothetical protein